MVGIDVGLDSLLTLSTGEKIANPRHERADRQRLARAQRDLARKQKGSANRAKARLNLARIHARIADRRRDHLHKLTTRLVRETCETGRAPFRAGDLARVRSDFVSWLDLSITARDGAWAPPGQACPDRGLAVNRAPSQF
ncbi:RNA-guided endonuclease InsQ/TnpB family protein [Catellatospora coxensis]